MDKKPLVREDGWLLRLDDGGSGFDIPLQDLKNGYLVFGWLSRLAEKEWFTREHLSELVPIIENHVEGLL